MSITRTYFSIGVTERGRVEQLLHEGVKRVLFSFGEFRGKENKLHWLEKFDEVMVDSGAFGHGNSGLQVDFPSYKTFLHSLKAPAYDALRSKITAYINFDNMNDPEETLANQNSMEAEGLTPVPVYHMGEDEKYLEGYCSNHKLVALGGLAVGQVSTEELKLWWNKIAEKYPKTKFHILGSSQFRAFVDHQPYSLDSTSWLADRFGNLITMDENGYPDAGGFNLKRSDGVRHFFTVAECRAQNIRAMLYLEKMEWTKPRSGVHQTSMFDFITEEVS